MKLSEHGKCGRGSTADKQGQLHRFTSFHVWHLPTGKVSLSSRDTGVCAVSEYKTVSYSFQILRLTISLMSCVRVLRSQEHTLGEATLVNPPRVALILSKDGG